MKLDRTDLRLLDALQADAQRSIGGIALEIGLSSSPCYRRQKLLESAGVIQRYVTLLDRFKLGFDVEVFVAVDLVAHDDKTATAFEREVGELPEVLECHVTSGASDYLLRVVTADLAGYERFLRDKLARMSGVRTIQSSFALRQVIQKTELPLTLAKLP